MGLIMEQNYFFHQTIQSWIKAGRGRSWIEFECDGLYIDCYIRVAQHYWDGHGITTFIDLATLETKTQRKGLFTKLVEDLKQYKLPLRLENVLDKEWERRLIEKYNWKVLVDGGEYPSDLVMEIDNA